MTIVIDVNSFTSVFDPANDFHAEFAPVKDWIHRREGFLLYGGKLFKDELIRSHHRARLVRLMKDAGMAVEIREDLVDAAEAQVRTLLAGTSCDDPHVIALLIVSRCPLLCSQDKRSFPFVKDRSNYPKGTPKVRIYTGLRNIKLLKLTRPSDIANVA